MNRQDLIEAAAKAEDTASLLDHIAWTKVVKPALIKNRDNLTQILVGAVLGKPQGQQTKEQIAGLIFGIDEIIRVFEKILSNGMRARRQLEQDGLHLTVSAMTNELQNALTATQ